MKIVGMLKPNDICYLWGESLCNPIDRDHVPPRQLCAYEIQKQHRYILSFQKTEIQVPSQTARPSTSQILGFPFRYSKEGSQSECF